MENLEGEGALRAIAFGLATFRELVGTQGLQTFYDLLKSLSLRPWWTRVWVLQGYALARSVMFVYGARHVEGELVHVGIQLACGMRSYMLRQTASEFIQASARVLFLAVDSRMKMVMLQTVGGEL